MSSENKSNRIPVHQVTEVALERIQNLKTKGGFQLTPYSLGAWSPSKYKVLDKCSLKFLLDYVLGIKVEESAEKSDDSALKYIGTAAHTILELCLQGTTLEEAMEIAKTEHYKDVTEQHWGKVEDLRYNIGEFLIRMREFRARNAIACIFPELKLAVDKDWNAVPFFSENAYYRGVVDLPMLMENGDVVIVDHKHGGSQEFGLRNYQFQLDSYKALFHFGKQKVKGAATGIHFIKEGEVLLDTRVSAASIEKIPSKIQVYIEGSVNEINDQKKFNYQRNSMCVYCDYQPICHNGKRGSANELQPIIETSRELF